MIFLARLSFEPLTSERYWNFPIKTLVKFFSPWFLKARLPGRYRYLLVLQFSRRIFSDRTITSECHISSRTSWSNRPYSWPFESYYCLLYRQWYWVKTRPKRKCWNVFIRNECNFPSISLKSLFAQFTWHFCQLSSICKHVLIGLVQRAALSFLHNRNGSDSSSIGTEIRLQSARKNNLKGSASLCDSIQNLLCIHMSYACPYLNKVYIMKIIAIALNL